MSSILDKVAAVFDNQTITNAIAYIKQNPVIMVVIFMVVKRIVASKQPFPTVDYGHVETVDSLETFTAAINQKTSARRAQKSKKNDAPSPTVTVVDFYATWCPPCKAAVPVFARMSEDFHPRGVLFYKCDVDQHKPISSGAGVQAMPTFKIYKNGECVETVQGFSEAKIREAIETSLKE